MVVVHDGGDDYMRIMVIIMSGHMEAKHGVRARRGRRRVEHFVRPVTCLGSSERQSLRFCFTWWCQRSPLNRAVATPTHLHSTRFTVSRFYKLSRGALLHFARLELTAGVFLREPMNALNITFRAG